MEAIRIESKNHLRRWECALLISLSLALCIGTWAENRQRTISASLVRLHVLAVSDDADEQALKLRVRDAVLEYISPKLKDVEGRERAERILLKELDGIKTAAESAAQGRRVTVSLGREYYPSRDYGSFVLPAGEYQSLKVVLGEGKGHNWWCVVFPTVCQSAAEEELRDALSGEDYSLVKRSEGYELRFRAVELWGELKQCLSPEA